MARIDNYRTGNSPRVKGKPRTGNSPRVKGKPRTGNSPRVKPKAKPKPSVKHVHGGATPSKARQANYARNKDKDVRSGSTAANPFNITKGEYRSAVAANAYKASRKLKMPTTTPKKAPAKRNAPWKPYTGK